MTRRFLCRVLVLAVAVSVVVAPSPALAEDGRDRATSIAVTGDVDAPRSYSPDDLAALPQLTLPITRSGGSTTVSGSSVLRIAQASVPTVPTGSKNPTLRVTATVIAAHGRAVTFGLGELDAGFGNRPAILRVVDAGRRIDLIVPGDSSPLRSLTGVTKIVVGVASPQTLNPQPGGILVVSKSRTVSLSARFLKALPARTTTVNYLAGTTPQQHTERGPQLWLVLLAAGVIPTPSTSIAAVGADGYLAVVTPYEALTGGRQMSLSLTEDGVPLEQPRLIVSGDVKGGRYVSDLVGLIIGKN